MCIPKSIGYTGTCPIAVWSTVKFIGQNYNQTSIDTLSTLLNHGASEQEALASATITPAKVPCMNDHDVSNQQKGGLSFEADIFNLTHHNDLILQNIHKKSSLHIDLKLSL